MTPESPDEYLADGAPSWPLADPPEPEPRRHVDGLYLRVYHEDCPAYGELRHELSGRRVVYLMNKQAAGLALEALGEADWTVPTPATDLRCQYAYRLACQARGVLDG